MMSKRFIIGGIVFGSTFIILGLVHLVLQMTMYAKPIITVHWLGLGALVLYLCRSQLLSKKEWLALDEKWKAMTPADIETLTDSALDQTRTSP